MGAKVIAYGKLYTGSDVKINMLGLVDVDGVDGIKFGDKRAIDPAYTMGTRESMGYIEKNDELTGTLTVKAVLLDAMQRVAPKGKLQDIPLHYITVTVNDTDAKIIRTFSLLVKYKGVEREMKNDNNELVHDIELFVGDIQHV